MIRASWWPAWVVVAVLGWLPLLWAPAPWWMLAGAVCYISATLALVGFHVDQHDAERLPRGRCCWCMRHRAVRWQRVTETRPGYTAMEGRCWLHWSLTPGTQRDLEVSDDA